MLRYVVGSEIFGILEAYEIELLASEEVEGYPQDVAERVGMLVSFNAGYGFRRAPASEPVDYSRYFDCLKTWRKLWNQRPARTARSRGPEDRPPHRRRTVCDVRLAGTGAQLAQQIARSDIGEERRQCGVHGYLWPLLPGLQATAGARVGGALRVRAACACSKSAAQPGPTLEIVLSSRVLRPTGMRAMSL